MKDAGKPSVRLWLGGLLTAAALAVGGAAVAQGISLPATRQVMPPAGIDRPNVSVPDLPRPPSVPDVRVPVPQGPASLPALPGTQGLTSTLPSGLGGGVGVAVRDAGRLVNNVQALAGDRAARLAALVSEHPDVLDLDPAGAPVVRGQIVVAQPSAALLAAAQAAGFRILAEDSLSDLDLRLVTFSAPEGLSTREAYERLASAAPDDQLDYNHLYAPSGMIMAAAFQAAAPQGQAAPSGLCLGLIDTGVDAAHPALAGARIEQRGFAPGGPLPKAHGTAVASLMAGQAAGFRGASPGAALDVADVYGAGPTGGSVEAVVRGMAWLGARQTPVINISLVGPPNRILQAAVTALSRRGVLIVAPVGNDGPAAPPAYPASYPGVVAVTGVDGRNRLLIEAGRALKVDFAAPASDLQAAMPGGGYGPVRGTSFAAPIVAGKLANGLVRPDPAAAAASLAALARSARRSGRDFGRGLVGTELRSAAMAGL